MNSSSSPRVERPVHGSRARTATALVAAALLGAGIAACVDIGGGAVELSWYLLSYSGDPIGDCECAGIDQVRVCWVPEDEAPADATELTCAEGRRSPPIPCTQNRGATDFVIDSKPHLFWIEPMQDEQTPLAPGSYEVPSPILRTVEHGSVVTLDSLLIVTQPKCEIPACQGADVCSSIQRGEASHDQP